MDFWIILFVFVIVILSIPYFRCFIKRVILFYKLKRLCGRLNLVIHSAHPLWFLGSKHDKNCDFYIESPIYVFAVKLFGISHRTAILIFKENGDYIIRHFLAFVSSIGGAARFPIDSKAKHMPAYNFRYNYNIDWEIKTPRNILLINPVCFEVRRQTNRNDEIILGAKDTVNGMEIYSLSRFLGELEYNNE